MAASASHRASASPPRAYERVTDQALLRRRLDELAATPADDDTTLSRLAEAVASLVLAAPVPAEVEAAVGTSYRRMGPAVAVAVRSSATAEDLPFASFAGQQDTFLAVVGEAEVIDAVRRCWASLWTERAVAYRARQGIDPRRVRIAVVVQRMVDAEVAGVLFTADPVTGRRRRTVIDASPGLGEAVVSGAVNPDHVIVDADSGAVVERRPGDKRLAIRLRPGGGTMRIEAPPSQDRFCLTDDQLRMLTALGTRVEQHLGSPQDIEWAIDTDGVPWLTQTRPITTLYPLPAGAPPPGARRRVYFCLSVAQGLNQPITPMGLASFRLLGSSVAALLGTPVADRRAGPPMYADAGQRLFADVTGLLRSRVGRSLMPRVLDHMEARSAVILRGLLGEPDLSLTQRSWRPFARRVLRVSTANGVPAQVLQAVLSPTATHRRLLRVEDDLRRRLVPPPGAAGTAGSAGDAHHRLDRAEQLLAAEGAPLVPRIMPAAATGFALFALAVRLLGADATGAEVASVLRGLPHNVTTAMDLDLWRLAQRIRADAEAAQSMRDLLPDRLAGALQAGTLPRTLQHGVTGFLAAYGHRSVAEVDLGVPRWADDPRYVFGVLANYLRLEDTSLAPDAVFRRSAEEAEAMVAALTGRARRRSRLRALAVGFALGRARQLAGVRELPKACLVRVLAGARAEHRCSGCAPGRGRTAGGRRRRLLPGSGRGPPRDRRRRPAPPGGAPAGALRPGAASHAGPARAALGRHRTRGDSTGPGRLGGPLLRGTPASAGTVAGVARVVLDPLGARLDPGEILVAPSTDPGWTPLFLTAGGLVMEMGGANSHGAVVGPRVRHPRGRRRGRSHGPHHVRRHHQRRRSRRDGHHRAGAAPAVRGERRTEGRPLAGHR